MPQTLIDQRFYFWAMQTLNPQVESDKVNNGFLEIYEFYDSKERFFHRGLGHSRSLFPPVSQNIHEQLLSSRNLDEINSKMLTHLPTEKDRIRESQEILAAFYHDIVHRNGKKPLLTMQPLTASLLDDPQATLKVEEMSCIMAEQVLKTCGIPEERILPILLAIIATIPFREFSEPGNLKMRLLKSLKKTNIKIDHFNSLVLSALALSNRDLGSYGNDSFNDFNKKTWAMMLERNPHLADPNHTILDEAETISSFYDLHKKLLKEIQTHKLQIYHALDPNDPIITKLNLQAQRTLQLDIQLQGILLGSAAILMNLRKMPILNKSDANEISPKIIEVLQNQNKQCIVNDNIIDRNLKVAAFALELIKSVDPKFLLEIADKYSEENEMRSSQQKKRLVLFVDINGTIIIADAAKGLDNNTAVLKLLADKHSAVWDPSVTTQEMTYRDFVKKICPGDEKEQSALYANFLNFLQENNHLELLEKIKKEAEEINLMLVQDGDIFPSFINLVNNLEANKDQVPYTIVLRTFGDDLVKTVAELERRTPLRFHSKGQFDQEGNLIIGNQVEKSVAEICKSIKPFEHAAWHDYYSSWKAHKFMSHGKPLPLDLQDPNVVTIFLDDNIKDKDKKILSIDLSNGDTILEYEKFQDQLIKLGSVVPVDTKTAITDKDYFIKLKDFAYNGPSLASSKELMRLVKPQAAPHAMLFKSDGLVVSPNLATFSKGVAIQR